MRLYQIIGYTGPNPDFVFDAKLGLGPDGVPPWAQVVNAIAAQAVAWRDPAAQLYADVAGDSCGDGERRTDLENAGDVATYLFTGIACEACCNTDILEGGGGVEFSCGERDCNPEPFMVVVRNISE